MASSVFSGAMCYKISWQSLSENIVPEDCISMGNHSWYGGSETTIHHWPINPTSIPMQPYITNDISIKGQPGHGSIQERYWLASNGIAVFVKDDVPLYVGIEPYKYICLKSQSKNSPYSHQQHAPPQLLYTTCFKSNVLNVHQYISKKLLEKPIDKPHDNMLKYPIWSTSARFKQNATQDEVIALASHLKILDFPGNHIEIDDGYGAQYGDHALSFTAFPELQNMTSELHKMGFSVSLWVRPFVDASSQAFQEGSSKGYFIKETNSSRPAIIKWKGSAGILDVTNTDAVVWYLNRLKALTNIGVDSFKFDGGESGFIPPNSRARKALVIPNMYSAKYVEIAFKSTNNATHIRTGHKTQHLPLIVRMMERISDWGYDRGLKSIIPTALHFSLLGYPFILPDKIGGNGYNKNGQYQKPDKELYIRWVQLSVFLPSIQFSFPPWEYDDETVIITHQFLRLRKYFIIPHILKLAEQSVLTGNPIIRPLWWIAPDDPVTYNIDSQFLVGNDILVAPMVDPQTKSRDIYLPQGTWRDPVRGKITQGPSYLKNYRVFLNQVPFFVRHENISNQSNHTDIHIKVNNGTKLVPQRNIIQDVVYTANNTMIMFISSQKVWLPLPV